MNVLYYLHSFPKLSESFILNEIYELEQRGHEVAVFALNRPSGDVFHEEMEEISATVHYADAPSLEDGLELLSPTVLDSDLLASAAFPADPKLHAANLFHAKRGIDFLAEADFDVDVVHSHFARPYQFGAQFLAMQAGVPHTITTHAYDLYSDLASEHTERLLARADRVVTISEYNRRYIEDDLGISTPVDVVHAGIRPEKFRSTRETEGHRVVTVARFVEKKGLRYAIDAVAEVAADIPDVEYHIIGSGPQQSDLERRAAEVGVESNVTILKNVSDERLIAELDEAACFLLPSVVAEDGDRDGIPVVLMEAMAMQTPVVSTRVSGIPELVADGENGLLTEPRNATAVAEAVQQILIGDIDGEMLGKRARETVLDAFNSETTVEKLESTFETAIEPTRRSSRVVE